MRRPPHRRPRRLGARTVIGLLLVAGLAFAGAGIRQAQAETPGQKAERLRARAVDVQATIDRMNDQVEAVVEQFNGNQEALKATVARQRDTARRLDQARKRLGSAQNVLGDRARSIYMNGPVTGLEQILEVRSPSDAVTVANYQQSASDADLQTIAEVQQSRQQLAVVAAALGGERLAQERLQSKLDEQRNDIESRLAEQRRLLNSLSASTRQALAQEQQRQEQLRSQQLARRLAAERAARAAAERRAARDLAARKAAQSAAEQPAASSSTTSTASTSGSAAVSSSSVPEPTPDSASTSRSSGGSGTTSSRSPVASRAIAFARAQIGKPYVWGGVGPLGFDCSGLTMMSYKSAGLSIPRVASAQYRIGRQITSQSQLEPGDLVFFAHGGESSIHHVGLYIGNGMMIEAPFTGANVRISTINRSGYFSATRPTG